MWWKLKLTGNWIWKAKTETLLQVNKKTQKRFTMCEVQVTPDWAFSTFLSRKVSAKIIEESKNVVFTDYVSGEKSISLKTNTIHRALSRV